MEIIKNSTQEVIKFKDYFEVADIVILAEEHGKHLQEISAFLDQFSGQMSGLFMEYSRSFQDSVDKYIEAGEIDIHLNSLFRGAMKEGKDIRGQVLGIFDKAKKYGTKVVCYDASKVQLPEYPNKAKDGYYFIKGECRDEDMFDFIRDYYQNHPGKYAVIVGSHHMTDENFEGDYKNFGPRMKEGFSNKCVAVKMADSELGKEEIYDDVIVRQDISDKAQQ